MFKNDDYYMKIALKEAFKASLLGEVPVGCVIVYQGKIISKAYNTRMKEQSCLGHAEINAIKKANKKLKTWLLEECTIYITLEPCLMCMGAILQARMKRIVFGAYEPKHGAIVSVFDALSPKYHFNHHIEWTSEVCHDEASQMLREFFKFKRKTNDKKT